MEGTTCSFGSFVVVVSLGPNPTLSGGPCGNYDIHHEGGSTKLRKIKWLKVVSLGCGPLTVTVTTRTISYKPSFLVGNPYKPSFPTVTVRGPHPMYHLQPFYLCHDMLLTTRPISRASAQIFGLQMKRGGSQIACRKGRRPCAKRRRVEMLVKRVLWGVVAQWQTADLVARWKHTV